MWFTSVQATFVECTANFSFEAIGKVSNDRLVEFGLVRPAPAEAPDHYASKHFRAYRVTEGADEAFAIERIGSHSESLRVLRLGLSQRTLNVAFLIKDVALGEDAAHVLVQDVLLKGLLRDRFVGSVDQIALTDTEIDATTTLPWL